MLLSTRSSAHALFLFALMAAPAVTHGSVVLASNAGGTGASLATFTEVEVELYYQAGTAAVTGMRFWFATGQLGAKGIFRDGDGNSTGISPVAGAFVRTDGAYDVYEFGFGGALQGRSQYYAGYGFTDGAGNAVGIGTTTGATVSFDASVFTSAGYGYVVPDPFPPGGTGNFPRFELIGTTSAPIPAPGAIALLMAGMGTHVAGGRRRREARA